MTEPYIPDEADLVEFGRAFLDGPLVHASEVADIEREAYGRGVALALSMNLADAWDEGYQAAVDEAPPGTVIGGGPTDTQNPYRPTVYTQES